MFQLRVLTAILTISLLGFQSGCRSRVACTQSQCSPIVSHSLAVPNSVATPGVSNDYGAVNAYRQSVTMSSERSGVVHVLTLEEALCVAAKNSKLARQLESQLRKLSQSSSQVECPGALNLAMASQITEERNRSASLAGQLFLGLVEVELQRELLIEAHQKLVDVSQTISEAEAEGFATSDAKEMLGEQTLVIAKRESELNYNDRKIRAQLKALLELDSRDQMQISYHLSPVALSVTLESEQQKARGLRAELVALRQTLQSWNQCSAESAKAILSAADPRMGMELAKAVLRSRWPLLRRRQPPQQDPCEGEALREQTQALLVDSEQAVVLSVEEIFHETQFAYESIVLASEDIHRLNDQIPRISAKKDLDATGAYIDLQRNWHETLLARSRRISEAVRYESGQIRLAEATGELVQICGCGFDVCGQNGL